MHITFDVVVNQSNCNYSLRMICHHQSPHAGRKVFWTKLLSTVITAASFYLKQFTGSVENRQVSQDTFLLFSQIKIGLVV
jgi:hypothetical protein